jgi:hypothetical protein
VFGCFDISVQAIAALANLDRLELAACEFERGEFAGLMAALMPNGRLHGLQELSLWRCCEMDSTQVEEIAQMLRSNTSIKELYLNHSPIGDEGSILLADALSNHITVTNLYLCGIGIGDGGAIALAGLLKKNATIQAVNLLANPAVTYKGRQALLKASLWNTSLEVLGIDDGLVAADRQRVSRTLEINRFRKIYLEQDHSTISSYLYPRILAQVSIKPSVFFLFLQENREMFIPHLPETVRDDDARPTRKR